ncbi:MAG TPA: ImmA/IrrE family metallo-endopeptidase [Candidatus Eremiobacteraceae bacterium]|nr:ImmA/IrrE family metallo-endopeptidase [Candidatus Eremiobacteraceae bacterium]
MARGFVDVQGVADQVLAKTGTLRRPNGYAVDIEAILRTYSHFDNMFAARVLMPKASILEAWRATKGVGRCAHLLEVSTEAAGYRLRELQLI